MRTAPVTNLLRIASELAEVDPIRAIDLERAVLAAEQDQEQVQQQEQQGDPHEFVDNVFKEKPEHPENPELAKLTKTLQDALGDEKKTMKLLKLLFEACGPLVEDVQQDQAQQQEQVQDQGQQEEEQQEQEPQQQQATVSALKILPVLVRTAHATPKARPLLIPVIKRIVTASRLVPAVSK